MYLTRCNLGKFLIVLTLVARRLQVRQEARAPSGESWNYCREGCPVILQKLPLPSHLGIFLFLQIYDNRATVTIR